MKEYILEHGGEEKELRREKKRKKWILMFYTYGEEEQQQQQGSPVYCEIRDSKFFIGAFYRRIIKY